MTHMATNKRLTSSRFFYVSIVLLFIIFHKIIESFISAVLVSPALEKVDSTIINDLVVILFSLMSITYTSRTCRTRYFVNSTVLAGSLIGCIVYSWYRFTEDVWHFVPMSTLPNIRYLDIIYLPFTLCVLLFISRKPSSNEHLKHSKFIEDNPLCESTKDILSYDKYCSYISEKINNSIFNKSFAIGINGEWGTGKTSFMHLIETHLTKATQTIIHFNPWSSHNANGITLDFFNALSKGLSTYHFGVSNKLNEYANSLIENSSNTLIRSFTVFKNNGALAEQYESINNLLRKIGRQTIIFIDDLDRLDELEAQEVIKLIRNTANFYNMAFIVAYDRNYLIQCIKKINDHNAEFFLEKIFQLEINLPHFEQKVIMRRLIETLSTNLGAELQSEIEKVVKESYYYQNHLLNAFIMTIRDVNRLTNSLILNYPSVRNEVVFSEFFLLELLKIKFPAVHELLYRHQTDFLETKQEGIKKFAYRWKSVEKSQTTQIEEYLEQNAEDISLNKRFIPKIMALLMSLFPVNQVFNIKTNNHLSIRYPSNFYKYFAFRLLDSNLSEVEFANARKSTNKQFNAFIREKTKQGHGWNLRDRFEDIKAFDDKEDFERVIQAIFHLAKQPNENNAGFKEYMEYSGEDLYNKLYNKDNVLAKKFYDGDVAALRQFVLTLFQESDYPYTVKGAIIKDMSNKTFLEGFVLTIEDLEGISISNLEDFLASKSNFSYDAWWHYNNCHFKKWHFYDGTYTSEVYIIPRAKTLLIDFLKKDIKGFLDTIIYRDRQNEEYVSIFDGVKSLFGDWETFYSLLETVDQTEAIIEFKSFFLAFKGKNFVEKIKFEFKHFENKLPL